MRKDIDALIAEMVRSQTPRLTVKPGATKAVERRLRAFPDVCVSVRGKEYAETIPYNHEIFVIKKALAYVSQDPYCRIIPELYFHNLSEREVASRNHCDPSTVRRNKKRLLEKMAMHLYGVEAWEM